MARIISGLDIGVEICKALGLEANRTKSVTIKIESNDIVRAEVVQYVYGEELNKVIEVLKKYHWEEDKDEIQS